MNEGSLIAAVAFSSFLLAPVTFNIGWLATYDNSPPITWTGTVLTAAEVTSPGRIDYGTFYTKRPACTPPNGTGAVHYKLHVIDDAGVPTGLWHELPSARGAVWPPSDKQRWATSHAVVPAGIPPGCYGFAWSASFACASASRTLTEHGPTIRVCVAPDPLKQAAQ